MRHYRRKQSVANPNQSLCPLRAAGIRRPCQVDSWDQATGYWEWRRGGRRSRLCLQLLQDCSPDPKLSFPIPIAGPRNGGRVLSPAPASAAASAMLSAAPAAPPESTPRSMLVEALIASAPTAVPPAAAAMLTVAYGATPTTAPIVAPLPALSICCVPEAHGSVWSHSYKAPVKLAISTPIITSSIPIT